MLRVKTYEAVTFCSEDLALALNSCTVKEDSHIVRRLAVSTCWLAPSSLGLVLSPDALALGAARLLPGLPGLTVKPEGSVSYLERKS